MDFMEVPDLGGGAWAGGPVVAWSMRIVHLDGRGQAVLMELNPAVPAWGVA